MYIGFLKSEIQFIQYRVYAAQLKGKWLNILKNLRDKYFYIIIKNYSIPKILVKYKKLSSTRQFGNVPHVMQVDKETRLRPILSGLILSRDRPGLNGLGTKVSYAEHNNE